jgi:hypothetical protein
LIIALPDARHFDGDHQPRWEIRLKMAFFAALTLLQK